MTLIQIKLPYENKEESRSDQISRSVMSDSLRPNEPQHTRPPCRSPTPRVYPNSCPVSWWCHPTISSSVVPFSSCPQSFPASGSFTMSWLFASGGQSIRASASASVLSLNIQGWFPLGLTASISLLSKGLLQHHSSKVSILQRSAFLMVQLSHPYTTLVQAGERDWRGRLGMDSGYELRRYFNSRGKKRLGLVFMYPLGAQRHLLNKNNLKDSSTLHILH